MIKSWWYKNLANAITMLRFVLCAYLLGMVIFHRDWIWSIFIVAVSAFITDIIDGPIARWLKVESKFGNVTDNLGDKILELILFLFFVLDQRVDPWLKWVVYPLAVIEIGMLAVRVMGYAKGINMKVGKWGKRKMLLIAVGITVCLAGLVAEESFGLAVSSFLVPVLLSMFAFSMFLGYMSLRTHINNYCAGSFQK